MAGPFTRAEPLDQRLHMKMTVSEMTEIDNFMFEHRIRSRSEAIRQLLRYALDTWADEPEVPAGADEG